MKSKDSQRVYCGLNNEVGSSLAELMISFAIILGGISAVLILFQSSLMGLQQTESKLQETGVLNELQLNLKNKEVCEKNFLTKPLDGNGGMNLTAIQDALGNRIADINANEPGATLKITALKLVTEPGVWSAFQTAKASLPTEGYLLSTTLSVSLQRLRQAGGNRDFTISVPVPLFIDTNAAIKGCLTPQTALEEAALATSCAQVGGVIDAVTKTCRFSADCAAVASDGKPFETQCLNNEITELKKTITQLQAQVKPSTFPPKFNNLMEELKWCMHDLEHGTFSLFDGNKLECQFSYTRTVTPTDVNAAGYHITDPKLAGRIFDELSKDYIDFILKDLIEGKP